MTLQNKRTDSNRFIENSGTSSDPVMDEIRDIVVGRTMQRQNERIEALEARLSTAMKEIEA